MAPSTTLRLLLLLCCCFTLHVVAAAAAAAAAATAATAATAAADASQPRLTTISQIRGAAITTEAASSATSATEAASSATSATEEVSSAARQDRPGDSPGGMLGNIGSPYFVNQPLPMQTIVALNASSGTAVYTLVASDRDPGHDLHFILVRDRAGGRFEVNERSGVVRTRGSEPFYFNMEYVLYVVVEDHAGLNEHGKFQQSGEQRLSIVGGKRPPQFFQARYEANIVENHTLNTEVIAVKAKSFSTHDIHYSLKSLGNSDGKFSMDSSTGVMKLTRPLDYEDLRQPHTHQLVVEVTEEPPSSSAKVLVMIHVMDVNDNSPRFQLPFYQVGGVAEDIAVGSELIRVIASDADSGANANFSYSLSERSSTSLFGVDEQGAIYSRGVLDADDNNGMYEFLVAATDRGDPQNRGTATVRVYTSNRNDESPRFTQHVYTPSVRPDAGESSLVTVVRATDVDGDRVTYACPDCTGLPFVIDTDTGEIRVRSGVTTLDRDQYQMKVTATDDGSCCTDGNRSIHTSTAEVVIFISRDNLLISMATAPVRLPDVIDSPPRFSQNEWNITVDETDGARLPGAAVLNVTVFDEDENNAFYYSVLEDSGFGASNFIIVPNNDNTGSLRIVRPLDYEDEINRNGFSFVIQVDDDGGEGRTAQARVNVKLRDVNDNKPIFNHSNIEVIVAEDIPEGTRLGIFSANDPDGDGHNKVSYVIDQETDREHQFSINEQGVVSVQRGLDRERERHHFINILAIDHGVPPSTATGTFTVMVDDVNDNPPTFLKEYHAVVPEHSSPRLVAEVMATDADGVLNGAPFSFRLDPTADDEVRASFRVEEQKLGGTNGEGSALVSSLRSFDYDYHQEYRVPIVIKDSGMPALSATSTLTVRIGRAD